MTANGIAGLKQLLLGMRNQLANFSFTPIPFFVIMGEVFFQSGIIKSTLDALSKLVRKVPGRLSIVTLLGGGIFAALSGSSLGNTAMFGSLMMPEMSRRGYSKSLTTGSIMAGGALAMIIPPSNQAVILGGIAGIPVGKILLGAIIPGVLLLAMYIAYVIVRCIRNPSLAPKEDFGDEDISLRREAEGRIQGYRASGDDLRGGHRRHLQRHRDGDRGRGIGRFGIVHPGGWHTGSSRGRYCGRP